MTLCVEMGYSGYISYSRAQLCVRLNFKMKWRGSNEIEEGVLRKSGSFGAGTPGRRAWHGATVGPC